MNGLYCHQDIISILYSFLDGRCGIYAQFLSTLNACFLIYVKAPGIRRTDNSAVNKAAQKGSSHVACTDYR